MMTLFSSLLSASGLSLTEAAEYLDVSRKNVERWSNSKLEPPEGVIEDMIELINEQTKAVDRFLNVFKEAHREAQEKADKKINATIEIGYPTDDYEAQEMGWPCASAFKVVIGRIAAACGMKVTIIPRGSNVSNAVAVDINDAAKNKRD